MESSGAGDSRSLTVRVIATPNVVGEPILVRTLVCSQRVACGALTLNVERGGEIRRLEISLYRYLSTTDPDSLTSLVS